MCRSLCCLALVGGAGCQSIVEDPLVDGGDDTPPTILLDFVTPSSKILNFSQGCNGTESFSVGEVEDFNLSAQLQEILGVNCSNNDPSCLYEPQALVQEATSPSIWTDIPYSLPISSLQPSGGNTVSVVQVWVSDAPFVRVAPPDGGVPTTNLNEPPPGHAVVEYDWIITFSASGPCPGATGP